MRALPVGAAMLLFLALSSPSTAESLFPFPRQIDTLANGLRVILIPMESRGLVAYYSIVRTGSRDEVEPGKSGFAHFFEHIMFRGTRKYPGAVYDSVITSIGASANAYTTDDYTAYHLNITRDDLEKVMEMESDRFQNLDYDEAAFQTEAGAVYGEYRKSITQPFALLNEKMHDLAYDVHTYKHTTIGFEADIKAMPSGYEYSKSFFRRYYRPDNVILLIVGDINPRATLDLVRRYYGGWKRGYTAPAITQEPPQRGERNAEVAYRGRTLPIVDIAYKGYPFNPADTRCVASLLLGDLAFGETSDIYKKLVIKDQKVQILGASIPMNRDTPLFEVYARVMRPEDIAGVVDDVNVTIRKFQTTPVDRGKLEDLKRRNKYRFLMGLDTPDHVAGGLARLLAITGDLSTVDRLYRTMDAIEPDDIMHVAKDCFVPEHRTTVILKGAQE